MKNRILNTVSFLFPLLSFFVLANPIRAQQPDRSALIVNTDLVVTWAQVTSNVDGAPVRGLSIDDFQLREEGKQQRISLVKEGQPLSIVILVDGMTCVSEPERWYRRREEILRQLGDDAEIALMAWDSDAILLQPLTTDHSVIAEKLKDKLNFFYALNPGPYGTEPYFGTEIKVRPERTHYRPGEAIYQATKYLEKNASPNRRKIIVVISYSGLKLADTHIHKASEVKALLKTTGTTVYGLVHNENLRSSSAKLIETLFTPQKELKGLLGGTLKQFVDLTGGATLTGEWEECDELFIKLARMIRSSYTIGYYPENSNFDGRFRRISLELSRQGKTKAGKATIKTRDGYHALRPAYPADAGMKR